jgi:hypothetical protein
VREVVPARLDGYAQNGHRPEFNVSERDKEETALPGKDDASLAAASHRDLEVLYAERRRVRLARRRQQIEETKKRIGRRYAQISSAAMRDVVKEDIREQGQATVGSSRRFKEASPKRRRHILEILALK